MRAAVMRPVTLVQLTVSRAVHLPASQQHMSGAGMSHLATHVTNFNGRVLASD